MDTKWEPTMRKSGLFYLFLILGFLILVTMGHLFAVAKGTATVGLLVRLLTVLSSLLIITLSFVLLRAVVKLQVERRAQKTGYKLKTKLVLSILPLTVVPAGLMLLFSSNFLDNLLSNLSVDANISNLIEQSDGLNELYLQEIGATLKRHGPHLLPAIQKGQANAVGDYLDRYGIQGVEVYKNQQFAAQFIGESYPDRMKNRLEESRFDGANPVRYDDGFFIWKFPFTQGDYQINFIFTQDSGLTERVAFIRSSYQALDYANANQKKVRGIYRSALIVIMLTIIFGGIWTGLTFARNFIGGFQVLIEGAKKVEKGQLDVHLKLSTGDEMEEVVHAFNAMTSAIKAKNQDLRKSAKDQAELNRKISEQHHYTQTILQEINAGILSLDQDGRLRTWNKAALEILGVSEPAMGVEIEAFLDGDRHAALLRQWVKFTRSQDASQVAQVELEGDEPGQIKHLACNFLSLKEVEGVQGKLLVLEDLTPLLNAQKLAAWREVAKRVAHEIKNPLTPIQLSMQRIQRKAQKQAPDLNEAIQSAYETILQETDLLKNLVNEFSTFAKLPAPNKSQVNFAELVRGVLDAYREVYPQMTMVAEIENPELEGFCDRSQMRQVLTNLIINAAQACGEKGQIVVRVAAVEKRVRIDIRDSGPGIPEEYLSKVFMPYFSKSPKGSGLGLAIVKRIVEDHRGSIHIESNQPQGTVFVIQMPLEQSA